MKNGALILAGGSGTRFGNEKKQFIEFHGQTLCNTVYEKVVEVVDKKNVVVVGVDVPGGSTRSESVMNGLNALPDDVERVIILEAARPLVTVEQIKQILNDENQSCTFVMPCVNSPIFRNGTFVDRKDMYDLLVPQAFDFKLLKKAYNTGKYKDMTDETRVMFEEYGIKPAFIETTQNLYKVTYKRDLAVLENIYQLMLEGKLK